MEAQWPCAGCVGALFCSSVLCPASSSPWTEAAEARGTGDGSGGSQAECVKARDGESKACTGRSHRASHPEGRPRPFSAQTTLREAGITGIMCVPVCNKCSARLLSAPSLHFLSPCFATGSTRCWTGSWGSRVRLKTTFLWVPTAEVRGSQPVGHGLSQGRAYQLARTSAITLKFLIAVRKWQQNSIMFGGHHHMGNCAKGSQLGLCGGRDQCSCLNRSLTWYVATNHTRKTGRLCSCQAS